MTVENLYENSDIDDYIITQCWRKNLPYDDSKQDIFMLVLEKGATTIEHCKRIANSYFRMQFYNSQKDNGAHDFDVDTVGDTRDYSAYYDGEESCL